VSRLGHFTPGTHWIGGWLGPITGLNAVARRKKSLSMLKIEPWFPSP